MMHPKPARKMPMSREGAEAVAVRALQYLAGDTEQLSRFVAVSGIMPSDLRQAAESDDFLSGVLDYFMGDEPLLIAFAASVDCDPNDISLARLVLSREPETE